MKGLPLPWHSSTEAARLWPQLRAAPRSILMLDYDGTLAPFHRDRLQAYPFPGVEERLSSLASLPRVRLALVSGRPARELQQLLGWKTRFEIWGNHGREHLHRDGSYHLLPLDQDQWERVEQVKREAAHLGLTSSMMEVKPASIAFHWRSLEPSRQQQLRSLVESLYARHAAEGGLELLAFDGGLEFRPSNHTKGTVVRKILSEEGPEAPAAYLGDDFTDEDAFTAIESRGLSILVHSEPRESSARFWIRPPGELLDFLDRWIQSSASAASATPGSPIPRAENTP